MQFIDNPFFLLFIAGLISLFHGIGGVAAGVPAIGVAVFGYAACKVCKP